MAEILVETLEEERISNGLVLLGDEALALGALHAGISAAYAYPGTPSTEILEYVLRVAADDGRPKASWAANEKTAYEQALGVCMVGRRALVAMKHVGLNVAADPFMNSALLDLRGGLLLAACDDPGMHSSQNEQDSRYMADFARVLCLEPANQQQAYEMAREAFDLSERFSIPVMVRLVTRLAHSRAGVVPTGKPQGPRPLRKPGDPAAWTLLPANARRQWKGLLQRQSALRAYSETCAHNTLYLNPNNRDFGVITAGIARNYYLENVEDPAQGPSHLHVGVYPLPTGKLRDLARHVRSVLVLEDGYPFIERALRGVLPGGLEVWGRESGHIPPDGELTPDLVRRALGGTPRQSMTIPGLTLPARPPQLCAGCPHRDAYDALHRALQCYENSLVTSDIGCYTLGALPPYRVIESCVCMGASVGMAKGASEAGMRPVAAVIGDSTFLHSGVTPLMDAAAADTPMTVIILDNSTVGMTGSQPTVLPSGKLKDLVLGVGVDPGHVLLLEAHPKKVEENAALLRRELEHDGLSVVIFHRECLESIRKHRSKKGDA